MRVGYYQFRPLFGQRQKNLDNVLEKLDGIDADLIVLPELAFTGYYFHDRSEVAGLAEDIKNSVIIERLKSWCRSRESYIITGFAEKENDRLYNSAVLIGPKGWIHTYRKIHLFNEEKEWFDAGDIPLQVHRIKEANIGIMVCFDWIFPEVVRELAILGADLICHPSNLVLSYCQRTMQARCIENHVFAITANRTGSDKRPHGNLHFTGKSQILDPRGDIIRRAPRRNAELFTVEIDPLQARNKMITQRNHVLNDRQPSFYTHCK